MGKSFIHGGFSIAIPDGNSIVRNRQLTQVALFRCLKTGCDAQNSRLEPQPPRKKKKKNSVFFCLWGVSWDIIRLYH